MQCPICKNIDTLRVKDKVQRGDDEDIRCLSCSSCGGRFLSKSVITHIDYQDTLIAIDRAKELIDKLQKDHLRFYQERLGIFDQ